MTTNNTNNDNNTNNEYWNKNVVEMNVVKCDRIIWWNWFIELDAPYDCGAFFPQTKRKTNDYTSD